MIIPDPFFCFYELLLLLQIVGLTQEIVLKMVLFGPKVLFLLRDPNYRVRRLSMRYIISPFNTSIINS